jgi:hypothetical protein
MQRVARRPSARAWILVALVALLGMTVAAGAGSAAASGPGHAVEAKKCKKHKRSATSAKKKKCKKKKKAPLPVQPVVLPAPGPLVRATLSWSANDEVDLHAYDASGNHAGWDNGLGHIVNNIPNAHHNGDVGPFGPSESFIDDIFVAGGPSNREFSYIACLYDNNPPDYTASFTGVTASGQSSTVSLDGPAIYTLTIPGGPSLPDAGTACGIM